MSSGGLSLGSSRELVNVSNDAIDELDYIKRTIADIYYTFDELKVSWQGEKASEYKATLEAARDPLQTICNSLDTKADALNKVGQILSDYRNR
jgi:uncharacterized protein YukE